MNDLLSNIPPKYFLVGKLVKEQDGTMKDNFSCEVGVQQGTEKHFIKAKVFHLEHLGGRGGRYFV